MSTVYTLSVVGILMVVLTAATPCQSSCVDELAYIKRVAAHEEALPAHVQGILFEKGGPMYLFGLHLDIRSEVTSVSPSSMANRLGIRVRRVRRVRGKNQAVFPGAFFMNPAVRAMGIMDLQFVMYETRVSPLKYRDDLSRGKVPLAMVDLGHDVYEHAPGFALLAQTPIWSKITLAFQKLKTFSDNSSNRMLQREAGYTADKLASELEVATFFISKDDRTGDSTETLKFYSEKLAEIADFWLDRQ